MDDSRPTPKIDSPRGPRAQRRAAGLVAQYIHELSERHAGTRYGSPAIAGHPHAGSEADHATESEGA